MIRETITFNFETEAQQRRFHERLKGEGKLPGYDYDNATTDPAHGGKMTAEMAAERIKQLEDALRDLVMLERVVAPDMGGKRRIWAWMQNGTVLAECLDKARELLRMERV